MYYVITVPKAMEPINCNLQNCKPNKPFLSISSSSQVFCYSNGKGTKTLYNYLLYLLELTSQLLREASTDDPS
jgi:hypothetical protein